MTHLKPGAALWLWLNVAAALTALTMSQSQEDLVPSIPASQEDSPLANLWRHALRKQGTTRSDEPGPQTFVPPEFMEVTNWVPQDSAHPLYLPKYLPLLREVLRDYMVAQQVKPDDPRLEQPDGLTVNNLNGKPLTFKKTATGLTVNDVSVEESKVNEDGTVSYILGRSLFGHREKINEAWEENNKNNPPRFGPFGAALGGPQ